MFGETRYHPENAYTAVPLEQQLEALAAAQQAGKIRHVGLSNETAWGLMECCRLGEAHNSTSVNWAQQSTIITSHAPSSQAASQQHLHSPCPDPFKV